MKKAVGLIIAVMFMFLQAGAAFAVQRAFTVQASVPAATGVAINASSVTVAGNVFTPLSSSATLLNFDTMTFNTQYGVWRPDHYFAIDVGTIGGGGNVTTIVTYSEGANPNGTGHGLGYKAQATFQKVTLVGGDQQESSITAIGKKRLGALTGGVTVTPAQITGGWLRVYLGVATGDLAEAADSEPFTNADKSGTYDGIITFSSTVA